MGGDMFKILVFNESGYREYPIIKRLILNRTKFYHKNNLIVVKEAEIEKPIDSYKEYHSADVNRYMCMGSQVRSYERKNPLWIGNANADIMIDSLPCEICIEDGNAYIKNKDKQFKLYKNAQLILDTSFEISEGDVLFLCGCQITFFKDVIEIDGDESNYTAHLDEEKSVDDYFEDFPHYKRSPRVIKRVMEEKVEIANPPSKTTISKGSLIQIIIPPLVMSAVTVGVGLLIGRGIYMMMSVAMTIVTVITSIQRFFSERKENKRKNENRIKVYDKYLLNIRKKIRRLRAEEKEVLIYQNPSLKKLEEMVSNYSTRIYERSGLDDDFLRINLGYRNGTSNVKVEFKDTELEVEKDDLLDGARAVKEDFTYISGKPVTIDLMKAHLGIVGEKSYIHEQLKIILAQLTFMQSYHDLEIIFIYNESYQGVFDYIKWYPHFKIKAINVRGQIYNERIRDQILGSLHQILKERKNKLEENKKETKFLPHYLFIIDEPKLITNHTIMEYLQGDGQELGFSVIYTTNLKGNLPENMHTVNIIENSSSGNLLLNEREMVDINYDLEHINQVNLEWMARNLSVLIHEKGMISQIPESIDFFEMYQVSKPEELMIKQRWARNESHKSLAVPLGVRAKEDYLELNLHEKAHGPHGLVAGTTGSGKSETIQSYILSLAVNFHPYEVGFLLIDYKGGGMAGLFNKLPHLLGTITNLDGAESTRAMASIKSELARRQRIFGENNVNHINGYNRLFKMGKVTEPLPHLFLISDEFAELKKEQPEFMTELVSAARIGRSLGIHLILATQKPSGVVDDQIWTNSKFKLCLKVQNEADSKEMLKTPDAANITQTGRAYLQVGNNEIYELFQSAWSGAIYVDEEKQEEVDDRVYLINDLGQGEVINQDLSGGERGNQIRATQLDVVVEYIHDIFQEEGFKMIKRPWLPSLHRKIKSPYIGEIQDSSIFAEQDLSVAIGLVDIPEEQSQMDYLYDFIKQGNLIYIASSGYGKSVFLGNIILGLAVKNCVSNLNMYIVDLGNSALIPYRSLPQTADYMTIDDTDKLGKFTSFIYQEIKERKQKFALHMAQNFEVYNQASREKLKAIVIVVDNFDVVKEIGYDMEGFFQKISRDGSSLGVFLVITATRSNAVKYATMNNFKVKIAGYNFEESEIRTIVGRSEYELPEIKGRAMIKLENVNMMQIYTPVEFKNDIEYSAHIRTLVSEITAKSTEEKAMGIPVLPDILRYEALLDYPGYIKEPRMAPIGINVVSLEVQYIDLNEPLQLIIGSSQTGKTNLLRNVLHHVKGRQIYLMDSKTLELSPYAMEENIVYSADKETIEANIHELAALTRERERSYKLAKEKDSLLLPKIYYQNLPPVYVIIDVVQDFLGRLEEIGDNSLDDILMEALGVGIHMVVTAETKLKPQGNFGTMVKGTKCGIILGDIKGQAVFSFSGIRETNSFVDIGYLHKKGKNIKIKMPRSIN